MQLKHEHGCYSEHAQESQRTMSEKEKIENSMRSVSAKQGTRWRRKELVNARKLAVLSAYAVTMLKIPRIPESRESRVKAM